MVFVIIIFVFIYCLKLKKNIGILLMLIFINKINLEVLYNMLKFKILFRYFVLGS